MSMPFADPHCLSLALLQFLRLIWQRFTGFSKLRYTNLITCSTQFHVGFNFLISNKQALCFLECERAIFLFLIHDGVLQYWQYLHCFTLLPCCCSWGTTWSWAWIMAWSWKHLLASGCFCDHSRVVLLLAALGTAVVNRTNVCRYTNMGINNGFRGNLLRLSQNLHGVDMCWRVL